MTAILRANWRSSVKWDARADTETGEPHSRGSTDDTDAKHDRRFEYGTGAGQATTFWERLRTVTAGSNDDLDLSAITQTLPIGVASLAFTCVKGIRIALTSSVSGDYLLVGKVSAVTNGWEGPFHTVSGCVQRVEHGGCFSNDTTSAAGWTVDSTHKVLRINNPGATSITYHIALIGEA